MAFRRWDFKYNLAETCLLDAQIKLMYNIHFNEYSMSESQISFLECMTFRVVFL